MKAVSPWEQMRECPEPGYQDFRQALNKASYHNAGSINESGMAKQETIRAAQIAIEHDWPYWAFDRMFKEIQPLVAWDYFMQCYINELKKKVEQK